MLLLISVPALTVENIVTAVKGLEKRWYEIGRWLYIPYETRQEMRTQHSTDMDKLKAVFLYVLTLHPRASWRCFISVFHRIGAHQIAARLSEYSEPVTGICGMMCECLNNM